MLTNTGKSILAKYLIGQAPAYASYISFGCGAIPKSGVESFGDYSQKESMDFEMFRAPITSRGYVTDVEQATITSVTATGTQLVFIADNSFNEGDVITITGTNVAAFNLVDAVIASRNATSFAINSTASGTYTAGGVATRTLSSIVFTAQLPTEERYEISEVGVYSAGANPSAGANDSKTMYAFGQGENWEYHAHSASAITIPRYTDSLDKINGVIPDGAIAGSINVPDKVFQANADNAVLDAATRISRNERPRFLNNVVFMRGDTSLVTGTGSALSVDSSNTAHIHFSGTNLASLDKNSGQDEIRLALSIVNKAEAATNPTDVKVIVEFANAEGSANPQYARFNAHIPAAGNSFSSNRYFVVSKKLEELEKTGGFTWAGVTVVKVYATILDAGGPSDDYYLGLDAIRLENTTTLNPLYGLVGYTVVKNTDGNPIIKAANTSNLMEFRFAMDVK